MRNAVRSSDPRILQAASKDVMRFVPATVPSLRHNAKSPSPVTLSKVTPPGIGVSSAPESLAARKVHERKSPASSPVGTP